MTDERPHHDCSCDPRDQKKNKSLIAHILCVSGKYLGWFVGFTGLFAMGGAPCPFCGGAACPVGAASAGLVGLILASLMQGRKLIAVSFSKAFRKIPVKKAL
jgi:hypothetical protein